MTKTIKPQSAILNDTKDIAPKTILDLENEEIKTHNYNEQLKDEIMFLIEANNILNPLELSKLLKDNFPEHYRAAIKNSDYFEKILEQRLDYKVKNKDNYRVWKNIGITKNSKENQQD